MPTKLEFKEIDLECVGNFTFSDMSNATAESTDTLDATMESFNDMESLIKKNFMMKAEKLEDFANHNPT